MAARTEPAGADAVKHEPRPGLRMLQRVSAILTGALIVLAAYEGWWPFEASPRNITAFRRPTVWQYLFSDRLTLGFVRLALAGFAIYVVVSVPALVVAARWAKGFGTTGLSADDAAQASKTLREYELETDELTRRLDAATATAERARHERDQALGLVATFVSDEPSSSPRPIRGSTIGEGGGADDPGGAEGPAGGDHPPSEGDR